jgi:hypothetical protein
MSLHWALSRPLPLCNFAHMWFFPHCVQADVGSLGFFITVGMDSFVFCLGVVMLKNVSDPAESAFSDALMRRLMFILPRGSLC